METYEELLDEVLSLVRDDVDKREGSIIYDTLAPICYFLYSHKKFIDETKDMTFVDTAKGEYLDHIAESYGISRKEASRAKRRVKSNKELNIGDILSIEDIKYEIKEFLTLGENYTYSAECLSYGNIGNIYKGLMEKEGDTSLTANLEDIIIYGFDREEDEKLRKRILFAISRPATSGNINHYINWALEVPKVNKVKVLPLDRGAGSLTILADVEEEDSDTLERLRKHIEEKRPVGASVYIEAPKKIDINLNISLTAGTSTNKDKLMKSIKEVVSSYLQELVFSEKDVSYARIASLILDIDGVIDLRNLSLNGGQSNIRIEERQRAVLGNISLKED